MVQMRWFIGTLTLFACVYGVPIGDDAAGPTSVTSVLRREPKGQLSARACEAGQWQCQNEALSNCLNGVWNNLITCSGATRCSGNDGTPPGCVWKSNGQIASSPPDLQQPLPSNVPYSDPVVSPLVPVAESSPSSTLDFYQLNVIPESGSPALPSPSFGVGVPPAISGGPSTTHSDLAESTTLRAPPVSPASPSSSGSTSTNSGTGPAENFKAPHIVIYMEETVPVNPWPKSSALLPINRVLLSFWTTDQGMTRLPLAWLALPEAERAAIRADYKANGIALMLSLFGERNVPTTLGNDPVKTAQQAAEIVKSNGFDGVDVNYEDGQITTQVGIDWVIAFQKRLRELLPPPYLISHAPQAPHFSPIESPGGAYMSIHKAVGTSIDFYNIQYYNQMYQSCKPFANADSVVNACMGMSIKELIAAGIPSEKLVIGKPDKAEHVYNSGLVTAAVFADIVRAAKALGWNAGIMSWEWSGPSSQQFMKTAWGA